MLERVLAPRAGQAFHYRDTGSPLHRVAGGWKLAAVVALGAAAVAARTPAAQAALLALLCAGYALARLHPAELWQDARWLAVQGSVVVALYLLRDGAAGAGPGLGTAVALLLFFLPGALLLRTTPSSQVADALRAALPRRLAFGLATSLRLLPAFARELHEIWMAQRLRGAHLAARDAFRPRAWRDAVECVGLPLAVRAIRMAEETALAAELRGLPAREEADLPERRPARDGEEDER